MKFIHDDPEFGDLVTIVADARQIQRALVEKDYWVTHTLWALHDLGLEVWFKGGTSLSKGFRLIHRFSEDLDLKIEPGSLSQIPPIVNWKSTNAGPKQRRREHFETMARTIVVPGAEIRGPEFDDDYRGARIRVYYPTTGSPDLPDVLRPFVLLEVGNARVTPFVARSMTSFVHDHPSAPLTEYRDNRPAEVRCVHPLVTLLEKLDAIRRRIKRAEEPNHFVRHFEDAAHIIEAAAGLPVLDGYDGVRDLAFDMDDSKQIRGLPDADDAAFNPVDNDLWRSIRDAHAAIEPMFWGPRISIDDACATIRRWIAATSLGV